jgi:hypothetical protein
MNEFKIDLTVFVMLIFATVIQAEQLAICTSSSGKRPITLTYRGNDILVIDGKYTAEYYDSDSFEMDGKWFNYTAYLNKGFGFWVETIDGKDSLSVVPARYIHGLAVDQDRTEDKYSCKWYK